MGRVVGIIDLCHLFVRIHRAWTSTMYTRPFLHRCCFLCCSFSFVESQVPFTFIDFNRCALPSFFFSFGTVVDSLSVPMLPPPPMAAVQRRAALRLPAGMTLPLSWHQLSIRDSEVTNCVE